MHKLKDKTLIITGASMGIGRALATAMAAEGINLVLNARSRGLLEDLASQCAEHGVRVKPVPGDITIHETVHACIDEAENGDFFGFIHVAGILNPGPLLWELDENSFSNISDTSIKASYLLIKHVVPELLAKGEGLAVFFGSGAAERNMPGIGAYCAVKAAEESLARQLAAETKDICSFIYRPGIVETRMQEQARHAEGGGASYLHEVFGSWKEKGELITPEQSASSLINLLNGDLKELHGGTYRAEE